MTEISTQLKKGTLELCVLALLNEESQYGYDLVMQLKKRGLLVTEGTLYPILIRLRADGEIESTWIESEQGRQRKYYSLTKQGKKTLERQEKEWQQLVAIVTKIILNH